MKNVDGSVRRRVGVSEQTLHQFLSLEEALEVPHLPDADGHEDERLDDGPPEDALVRALAGQTETLLTVLQQTRQT